MSRARQGWAWRMLQQQPPPPPQQQQQRLVNVQHGERYDNVSLVWSLGNTATTTTTTRSRHSHLVISERSQITQFWFAVVVVVSLFGWLVGWLHACLLACLLICLFVCLFSFHQFKFKARVITSQAKTKTKLHHSSGRGTANSKKQKATSGTVNHSHISIVVFFPPTTDISIVLFTKEPPNHLHCKTHWGEKRIKNIVNR